LQSWLDAQESRRDAERALAIVRLAQLKNCMALYQSLGGGDKTDLIVSAK
jgi:outer membrane protein TolC